MTVVSGSSKKGGGCIFESCDISLPSFVSPSSASLVLLWCFLLNITACTAAQLGGRTLERRAPFATTSFKKGGWAYFQGWAYFREITVLGILTREKHPLQYLHLQKGVGLFWRDYRKWLGIFLRQRCIVLPA